MPTARLLIAGPSAELCESTRQILAAQGDLDVQVQVGELDRVERSAANPPAVLVALLGTHWESSLAALATAAQRPPTIAIGPSNDPQIMRRAMQAGVRDYIGAPFAVGDLVEAAHRIAREQAQVPAPADGGQGQLLAVINVKGGSGASFIAANTAHIIASQRKCEVGLLDLDLQFGALPLVFDLEQRSMLLEALASSAQIDATALRGYMARHSSGVHVISAMSEQLVLPWEVSRDALLRLLQVMRQAFPVVIVDLPRQIDPLTSAVLEQADHVLMVMQQSLAHARDAKRMQRVLTSTLGLPRDRILLIVNRHSEKQSVRGRDVEEAVKPSSMMVLPNDFTTVSEALNIGVPVLDYDHSSPITAALIALVARLGLAASEPAGMRKRGLRGMFSHALGN
jgi:pilus assembly protein CpaE